MLGLAIRYGHLEDANAIAELASGELHKTEASEVTEMFSRGSFLVLDRDHGGLAASVFLEIREGRGEVGLLSVAADLDGANLSQRLLEVAEMVCVAEGCEALELHVDATHSLPELSHDLGFTPVDDTRLDTRLEKRLG